MVVSLLSHFFSFCVFVLLLRFMYFIFKTAMLRRFWPPGTEMCLFLWGFCFFGNTLVFQMVFQVWCFESGSRKRRRDGGRTLRRVRSILFRKYKQIRSKAIDSSALSPTNWENWLVSLGQLGQTGWLGQASWPAGNLFISKLKKNH